MPVVRAPDALVAPVLVLGLLPPGMQGFLVARLFCTKT